jgi:hypothetical protein
MAKKKAEKVTPKLSEGEQDLLSLSFRGCKPISYCRFKRIDVYIL